MAESTQTRTLRDLTRVVFTHWVGMLLIVGILTGGTYLACLRATKAYTSSVTFLARQPRPRNPTAQNVSADRALSVFIKTQEALATSDTVLLRTLVLLRDAGLRERWAAARSRSRGASADPAAWTRFVSELDAAAEARLKGTSDEDERFRREFRELRRNLRVETPGGSDVISMSEILNLSVTWKGSPKDARDAADVLAQTYIDRYREVGAGQSRDAMLFVQDQLKAFEANVLQPAEKAVAEFVSKELESPADLVILEQLSKAGTEAGRQIVVRRFQEETITLDGQVATARQLQQQLLQQVPAAMMPATSPAGGRLPIPDASAVNGLSDDALKQAVFIVPEDVLKSNDVIANLKKKEVELIVARNRLEVQYQDTYRELVDVNAEIVKARREILRELIGEVRSLDIKIATMTARQDEIQAKIQAETKRLDKLSNLLVRYQQLQHELTVARDQYRTMRQDLLDAQSQQQQEREAITLEIVGPPTLPDEDRPAFPKTPLFTAVAAMVGLLLSVAHAFLTDHFDHTLRWSDEVERYVGVPVVGSIRKHGGGLLT